MENAIKRKITRRPQIESFATGSPVLPYAALTAAVFFWGASFPAIRVAVTLLDPQAVMFCRMVVACLIMVPFAAKLRPSNFAWQDLKLILPMVLLQPCLYFFLESNALTLTTSSQAGIISASVPVLVAIGAWMFLKEGISAKIVVGLVVSVGGVSVLTLAGRGGGSGSNPILGNGLELCAMACAAGNLLLVKGLSRKFNSWTLTGMQFLTGLIFFAPGIRHIMAAPHLLLRLDLTGALVFLGAFASVGAFGLYNWAMTKIPASRASVFINLVPAVAVVLGWGLLDEALTPGQIAGALLVGGGVLISQRR